MFSAKRTLREYAVMFRSMAPTEQHYAKSRIPEILREWAFHRMLQMDRTGTPSEIFQEQYVLLCVLYNAGEMYHVSLLGPSEAERFAAMAASLREASEFYEARASAEPVGIAA